MEDVPHRVSETSGDYVQFWTAGDGAKGQFHCSDCGYGVTVYRELPLCPMCGCTSWEEAPWTPFSRSAERA